MTHAARAIRRSPARVLSVSFALAAAIGAAPRASAQVFGPPHQLNSVLAGLEAKAADFDGDGDQDLLSSGDGGVAWFANQDGLGGFGAVHPVASTGSAVLFAADLDGDGDPDVVSGNSWYENTAGAFAVHTTSPSFGGQSVHCQDLDGDGDVDVLFGRVPQSAWLENLDGLGTFGAAQVIPGTSTEENHSVYAADLDGDGDADALRAAYTVDLGIFPTVVEWSPNTDGAGTFGAANVVTSQASGVRSVHAADLDGDGDRDVLSASYGDNELAWYPNTNGLGSFGAQQIVSLAVSSPYDVGAADVDGDGDQDVLSASAFDHTIAWYPNTNGAGVFGGQQIVSSSAAGARAVLAADLDGDGDQDLASASKDDVRLAWYENVDGAGAFGPQQTITFALAAPRSLSVEDLDGDGDRDVLVASSADDRVSWFRNGDGAGSYGPFQTVSAAVDGARQVAAMDLDGDGDRDALATAYNANRLEWFANTDGLGAFAPTPTVTAVSPQPTSMFAADLDGDGDLDVLVGSTDVAQVVWHANTDGAGALGPAQPISSSAAATADVSVHAADIDGDGDVDALSTLLFSFVSDSVAWYSNLDGLGAFGSPIAITAGMNYPRDLVAADLDGDGDRDVLVDSDWHDELVWFRNTNGLGSFGPKQLLVPMVNPSAMHVADLNGDGDLDVLGGGYHSGNVVWIPNMNGLGVFGQQQLITSSGWGIRALTTADVDGDSDLDVFFASEADDEIAWCENHLLASAEIVRLGTPPNPFALLPGVSGGPVVGSIWSPVVSHASFLPAAIVDVLAIAAGPANIPSPLGTILCDFSLPPKLVSKPLPGTPFVVLVPQSSSLVGMTLSAQAGSIDLFQQIALTNALDLTIGSF